MISQKTARNHVERAYAKIGASNKQIAAQLVISEKTARNHVERVYTTIGVSNRIGASMYALRHGLGSPED